MTSNNNKVYELWDENDIAIITDILKRKTKSDDDYIDDLTFCQYMTRLSFFESLNIGTDYEMKGANSLTDDGILHIGVAFYKLTLTNSLTDDGILHIGRDGITH